MVRPQFIFRPTREISHVMNGDTHIYLCTIGYYGMVVHYLERKYTLQTPCIVYNKNEYCYHYS